MNLIKITDRLTNSDQRPKPIKLIGCLQTSLNDEDSFSFGTGAIEYKTDWGSIPHGTVEIERIHRQKINGFTWDFMLIHRQNDEPCLFIGEWNDGVLKEY